MLINQKYIFLLLIGTAFIQVAFSQNQNNQWRFGSNGAIDFNTLPPTSPTGSVMQASEGSASIADRQTGALLFYTDGVTIWNANNQPMPNGTGLFGGTPNFLSSTTAAVIIPKPAAPTIYYVVTIDEQASNRGVRYSVVDMALNGGLGDVISGQKNVFLFSTTSEKLHVVPTADGCGYWLLTHDNPGNTFFAFKLTDSGFQTTPVSSSGGGTQGNGAGHMKVNRQFDKLALGDFFSATIELFDFDNTTGVVSNPLIWSFTYPNSLIYGVEFSPDGSKLYVSNLEKLIQYDLNQSTAANIQASAFELSLGIVLYAPASLQLGPDGRIYIATGGVDAINFPDKAGAACGFQQDAIVLQNGITGYGLPQWIYDLAAPAGTIVFENTCLTDTTRFSLVNSGDAPSISWNFGDPLSTGNTSVLVNPTHTFTQAGSYLIQAIINRNCSIDTLTETVDISTCTTGVNGIKINGDTCSTQGIDFQVEGTSSSTYFFWNFDDPASGTQDTVTIVGSSPSPFPTHIFSAPGIYNVCVTFTEPGLPPTTVCRTLSIGLCCSNSIRVIDSCLENSVALSINSTDNITSVLWDFGDPLSGAANSATSAVTSHLFSAPGAYTVQAEVGSDCGITTFVRVIQIERCNCNLFIPNAFTPNNDGLNDRFQALANCDLREYSLTVYNRWGELVYSSVDPADSWDGKFRSRDCPSDVYAYVLSYKLSNDPVKTVYGDLTLLY